MQKDYRPAIRILSRFLVGHPAAEILRRGENAANVIPSSGPASLRAPRCWRQEVLHDPDPRPYLGGTV